MAKHKLLAGLVLGGAAYAAYHALDLEKREALKDMAREHCDAFKDRAIDYAFYAADALDDFKETLNDHVGHAKDEPDGADWRTATDETADATDDDIILNGDDVATMSEADSTATTSAAPTAVTNDAPSDASTTDQPAAEDPKNSENAEQQ